MCKEIKTLTELSESNVISKRYRDAIIFILRETGNIKVEPDKGFDGFDFSSWPSIPSKTLIRDWVATRKSKGKSIITQTFINSCTDDLVGLNNMDISVDSAISFAAKDGWQGFKGLWVLNEIEKNKQSMVVGEDPGQDDNSAAAWVKKIKNKQVTSISQIPKGALILIEEGYKNGRFKPETMNDLEVIGFAV